MMKKIIAVIYGVLLQVSLPAQTFEWGTAKPEELGFSSGKMNIMRDSLAAHGTEMFLVIRNDKIVMEWFAPGWDKTRKHYTASLSKALVGGMSLLVALNDGRLKVDDPVCKYIPEWGNDPLKSQITIRHLATHSSGVEDAELNDKDIEYLKANGIVMKDKHMDIPGWKGQFWRQDPDPFTVSRDSALVNFKPGTSFHYSNPGIALLSYAITSSYQGTGVKDIRSLLAERVIRPIGIKDNEWGIGYGKTYNINGLNIVPNWGGGYFTPRATARIGRLMLRKGNWEGKQLLDSVSVETMTKWAGTPVPARSEKNPFPGSGLAWYTNFDGVWPKAPRDLFSGHGAGNQTLIVIPSLNIIVVRNGANMSNPGEGSFYGIEKYLVNLLMDALVAPPYPKSDFISNVKFDPVNSVIRQADGSDNWPSTWADDDNIYSAYGDGWGFDPKVEKKLSLGLVKIIGNPPEVSGMNIRSETAEQIGQGRYGKKASGMLMVNSVLYMWIRNANLQGEESQLMWSKDHGKIWITADWKFTEGFGCPTFLNFGKNYKGARDNYVYIYSFDDKDAYKPSDRMVMARVDKNRITDRNAYEFFLVADVSGKPIWTKDISQRGAVFTNPANCYRSHVTYNPGLKRYLWIQILPHSTHPQGPRFQGGLGIYESTNPWGPWRTVYFTKEWDMGPGESAFIPTKWMSKDGKICWLLFSGDDCFSLRKVEFSTESR